MYKYKGDLMKKLIFMSVLLISLILFFGCTVQEQNNYNNSDDSNNENIDNNITNFEECINAGFPAMESYPRQCSDGENTFVEEIDFDTNYQNDGFGLYKTSEGKYICVGCGEITIGEIICQEPLPDSNWVEETSEVYCDGFDVVRENIICPAIYMPVCGAIKGQCITKPCDPIEQTFGNECELNAAKAEFLYDGQCRREIPDNATLCTQEQKQAVACTKEYIPVCGENNVTYGNKCEACSSEGVNYYLEGVCKGEVPAGATACTQEQKQAEACTLQYDPVCGDNEETYGNACGACSSGDIEYYFDGEC